MSRRKFALEEKLAILKEAEATGSPRPSAATASTPRWRPPRGLPAYEGESTALQTIQ
jgi:hypothetical protein